MAYNNYQQIDYNDEEKVSKLNSGGLINLRLDILWKDSHKHSRSGLYSDWNADLDCIWDELGGEYEENSTQQKELDKINEKLSNVRNWNGIDGFKRPSNDELKEKTRQYLILRKKSLFLRRIMNVQGKGTAYSDGSEDDWE